MARGRREFLQQLVLVPASLALVPAHLLLAGCGRTAKHKESRSPTFSAGRRAVLEAVCIRILPSEDGEPGAREAGCAEFIDRQLGLAHFDALRRQVERGLDALDESARKKFGRGFAELEAKDQDALLLGFQQMVRPVRGGYVFNLLLTLTLEGFLSDPKHGGNQNGVGWAFVEYRDCFYHGHGIGLRGRRG